ncbi:MAG: hypothetical protein ACYC2G_01845 [Gemmatimonadaceae bacterium]
MRSVFRPFLAAAVMLVAAGPSLRAQVVERPVAFDSAGRVLVITPETAARARLAPPAWRVTGGFDDARLFSTGGGSYVLVVTRPSGAVERYDLTAADVADLRRRVALLPPARMRETDRAMRNAFIRNQTLLGLGVYAPSFAYTVTNDDAGRVASWLLVSGVSYFAASTIARDIAITPAMNRLATHAALHGGAAGLGIGEVFDMSRDGRAAAAFLGSVGGAAAGIVLGRDMTPSEAVASGFGADAAAGLALGLSLGADAGSRTTSGAMVAAGLAGYPLGLYYARSAPYNVTAGDVRALTVTAAVGALATSPFLARSDASGRTVALALTGGAVAGLVAGDRFLVRRYDHNTAEGTLLALGAGAGGLMGAGVATLIGRDEGDGVLVASLASVGAIAGIAISERLLLPRADARRLASGITVQPLGLAMAAAGMPGNHPLLRLTF